MKKYKAILVNFIKIIYLIAVFLGSILLFSHFMSQGNVDMTSEMSEASLPVIHLNVGENYVNYLYGYTQPMETSYMRDTLTVVDNKRSVNYTIDTYSSDIASMYFEVRSIDGTRLVEKTDINIYATNNNIITGNIVIKDLIENGSEYMLIWVLELQDGQTARYYTRLLWSEDLHVEEKVDFVKDFCLKTFDKEAATELTKYLETNSSGDNSSFAYTNIHSNFKQVTWGDLDIRRIGDIRISICELTSATGFFKAEYQVGIQEESGRATCNVTEYFRLRYTTDRIYLLNWERYCNQIFAEEKNVYVGDQIELGITSPDIEIVESDGGNEFAFVQEGKLMGINLAEQKIAKLYTFYSDNLQDLRCSHNDYKIHILSVDEVGNVTFLVYGYMNRGIHEGKVGVALYEYNSAMNTVEEMAYLNYPKSAAMLMANIDELSYVDRSGNIYFMLERSVYEVSAQDQTITEVAESLNDNSYYVSESGRILVWQDEGDTYDCTRLRLMNLASGISEDIKAGYGDYIMPLGFMNEDLVYGEARSREVYRDIDGSIIYPMYKITIRSSEGEILKEYTEPGIYVMKCDFSDGLINMDRAVYNDNQNLYEATTPDQIVSNVETSENENKISEVVTENLETVIQISMKEQLKEQEIVHQAPKEILHEGNRELQRSDSTAEKYYYYVYGLRGYMG